jgi:hypothetical protein
VPEVSNVIAQSVTQTPMTIGPKPKSAPSFRTIGPKPQSPGFERPHE